MDILWEFQARKIMNGPHPKCKIDCKAKLLRREGNALCVLGSARCYLFWPTRTRETADGLRFLQQWVQLNRTVCQIRLDHEQRHHKLISIDDNAPSPRATAARKLVTSYCSELPSNATWSPDWAPIDYHLFALLEYAISKQRFSSLENLKNGSMTGSKQNQKRFWRSIHKLPEDGGNV